MTGGQFRPACDLMFISLVNLIDNLCTHRPGSPATRSFMHALSTAISTTTATPMTANDHRMVSSGSGRPALQAQTANSLVRLGVLDRLFGAFDPRIQ